MKLEISIDGRRREIELEGDAPGCRFRLDGGPLREADVEVLRPGSYSILMDGRVFDVNVTPDGDGVVVLIDGQRYEVAVRDPRRWPGGTAGAGATGVSAVQAPMPGKVVRLLVSPGDTVAAGQGVAVVEAMKMQNEMRAARAGRVTAVLVREGATVSAGDVLATIE